ncbi:MAG: hypothetical protein A3K19_25750 [Lentisphaerae bacterium RIFOXYB12_FULL_65_16]|nr:MAG: hypothetical protein A3K18_03155 [Lentisphaerae bacterium RIFOXYA12_64_32]OGV89554.1 MAG: hypothetical protein A3K19_25750 [Lentisphaerae bacterium RIFOXYB12_FULL_65_16]
MWASLVERFLVSERDRGLEGRSVQDLGMQLGFFARHAEQAGIDRKISPKTLRHTFATHMYERGVAVEDTKEMMGHDTDTETCIYIHVSVEAAKQLLLAHIANRNAGR